MEILKENSEDKDIDVEKDNFDLDSIMRLVDVLKKEKLLMKSLSSLINYIISGLLLILLAVYILMFYEYRSI